MSHTDPVILALRALGETAGTAEDAEHAQTCPQCRSQLARLAGIVELARDEGAAESLQTPPPYVWDRIAAAAVVRGSLPVAALGAVSRAELACIQRGAWHRMSARSRGRTRQVRNNARPRREAWTPAGR